MWRPTAASGTPAGPRTEAPPTKTPIPTAAVSYTHLQLVEQHEAVFVRLPQNGDEIDHVAGKGGQRLLNALLVADVAENMGENRNRAALCRRDVKPRGRHEVHEPQRLERHGLAARVGAGDNHGVDALSLIHILFAK